MLPKRRSLSTLETVCFEQSPTKFPKISTHFGTFGYSPKLNEHSIAYSVSSQRGEQIFEVVKAHLSARGMTMRQGTIVDATLIAAPSSTKNKAGKRDPEMHQTKKGNQWYFGMKVHIGVDSECGIIHSAETTAANLHDLSPPASDLLHGQGRLKICPGRSWRGCQHWVWSAGLIAPQG